MTKYICNFNLVSPDNKPFIIKIETADFNIEVLNNIIDEISYLAESLDCTLRNRQMYTEES